MSHFAKFSTLLLKQKIAIAAELSENAAPSPREFFHRKKITTKSPSRPMRPRGIHVITFPSPSPQIELLNKPLPVVSPTSAPTPTDKKKKSKKAALHEHMKNIIHIFHDDHDEKKYSSKKWGRPFETVKKEKKTVEKIDKICINSIQMDFISEKQKKKTKWNPRTYWNHLKARHWPRG